MSSPLHDHDPTLLSGQPSTDAPTVGPIPPPTPPLLPSIPGYEILEELARGGMGVVYKARQIGFNRVVALKMILSGSHAGPEERERFRIETEAVARLQHPNIVQVHEVGEHEGKPFFSMEFCPGGGLDRKLNAAPLPPTEAAQMVETLARGIQAAHDRGVVHRDLKPANVLLAEDGRPKVVDFGLAKRMDAAGKTQSGAVLGTPSYMAPEQAGGKSKEIGPRTDVYALGAILYECLTGRPPFKGPTALETLTQVLTVDPIPPRQLQPRTPRDLETICLKCLEKQPARRYATAAELATDLKRFQEGDVVRARPIGSMARGMRWVRRRPTLAGLLGVSGLAIVALARFVVGLLYNGQLNDLTTRLRGALRDAQFQRDRTAEQKAEADKQRVEADRQRDEADRQRDEADKQRAKAEEQHRIALEQKALADRYRYVADMNLTQRAWQDKQFPRLVELLQRYAAPGPDDVDYRGFEWHYLQRLRQSGLLSLEGHTAAVRSVAFSPDGQRLASAGEDGAVILWDGITGRQVRTLQTKAAKLWCVAFSPDGKLLASGGSDHVVTLWDPATGEIVRTLEGHTASVASVAFSPNGKLLASGSDDADAILWDPATGENLRTLEGHKRSVYSLAFSPDGKRLATGSLDQTVKIWDPATGENLRTLEGQNEVYCVAFSPDGKQLASTNGYGRIKISDPNSGQDVRTLDAKIEGKVACLAYSPDGKQMVSSGTDRTLTLWDVASGQQLLTSNPHTDWVYAVAFSPDGTRLASASKDHTVRVWDVTSPPEAHAVQASKDSVWSVAFAPDGRQLAWGGLDGSVLLWDLVPGHEPVALKGHTTSVMGVAFSPDGARLATASEDGICKVWDVDARREIYTINNPDMRIRCLAFSRDGRRLALAGSKGKDPSSPGEVSVWDTASGRFSFRLPEPGESVFGVAFSPDGRWIASTDHFDVKIWDATTQQVVHILQGHTAHVLGLAFSPDSARLASVGQDGTGIVWDVHEGREIFTLTGHTHFILSVTYSLDGKRLATAGMDQTVRLWDSTTGQEVLTLRCQSSNFYSVAFRPDGRQLAAGGGDGTVMAWDAEDKAPAQHPGLVESGWLDWHRQEAQAAGTNKQWFAAAFHLGRVIAHEPDNGKLYAARAAAYFEMEDWTRTLQDASRAIQLNAADARIWFLRGQAYANLDQTDKAIADYSKTLELNPKNWEAWLDRGYSYANQHQWEKAASDYTRAASLNPNYWKIRYKRGMAYAELGRWEKAAADFAKCSTLGENTVPVLEDTAEAQLAAGDAEAYRATCAALLEAYGETDDARTANGVAWTCAVAPGAVADLTVPIRLAEQAAASDGKNWAYLGTLGGVYYRACRFEEAIRRMNETAALNSKQGHTWEWLFLAMAHYRLGHADEAGKWLDRAEAWFKEPAGSKPGDAPGYSDLDWTSRLELQLLRREAEDLIRPSERK